MTPAWTTAELTGLGRLPMHGVPHPERYSLDGRWRFQLLSGPARALIEAGRRLVVVADHSKWGVIGISSIARLDQADVLITDSGLEPVARSTLEGAVRDLVVVDVGPSAPVLEVARAQ